MTVLLLVIAVCQVWRLILALESETRHKRLVATFLPIWETMLEKYREVTTHDPLQLPLDAGVMITGENPACMCGNCKAARAARAN